MPSAKTYTVNGVSQDGSRDAAAARAIEDSAQAEFRMRRDVYDKNRKYYIGDHKKPLKITGGYDDNVILNWCGPAVDSTVNFLFPNMPSLERHQQDDTTLRYDPDSDEDNLWMNHFWENNGGVTALQLIARNGALSGHNYVMVFEGNPYPRVVPLDPRNIITWWYEDEVDRVLWYEQRWSIKGSGGRDVQWRQDFVAEFGDESVPNSEVVGWSMRLYMRSGQDWELKEEVPWPYVIPPIIEWQHLPRNNMYYGDHELNHADLNDTANYIASQINRIHRFHAFPVTIFKNFYGELGKLSIDGAFRMEGDGDVQKLEMQSDMGASFNWLAILKDQFYRQSKVVDLPPSLDAFSNITNLGIRVAYNPMIQKNKVLRGQYGKGIKEITQIASMLARRGYTDKPSIMWSDPLPIDEREEFELIDRERGNGYISMETARERLGINHEQERDRIQEERLDSDIMIGGGLVGISG